MTGTTGVIIELERAPAPQEGPEFDIVETFEVPQVGDGIRWESTWGDRAEGYSATVVRRELEMAVAGGEDPRPFAWLYVDDLRVLYVLEKGRGGLDIRHSLCAEYATNVPSKQG